MPNPQALSRRAGIICFMLALAANASFDVGSKALLEYYPAPFLNFMRYATISVVGLFFLARHGMPRWAEIPCKKLLLARGLALGFAGTSFMTALIWMPLSEATAIYFTSPLIMVALSPWMIGERVGAVQWLCVAAGFAGMLFIVRPGSDLPMLGTLLMAAGAVGYALFQIYTRKVAGQVAPHIQYVSTAFICLSLTIVPLLLFLPRPMPSPLQFLGIVAIDLLNGIAQVLIIAAYRRVDAGTLGPLNYCQLIMAVALSTVVLHRPPDGLAMVGMAIIAAAGILLVRLPRRER